jgi:hypothetical protein
MARNLSGVGGSEQLAMKIIALSSDNQHGEKIFQAHSELDKASVNIHALPSIICII